MGKDYGFSGVMVFAPIGAKVITGSKRVLDMHLDHPGGGKIRVLIEARTNVKINESRLEEVIITSEAFEEIVKDWDIFLETVEQDPKTVWCWDMDALLEYRKMGGIK